MTRLTGPIYQVESRLVAMGNEQDRDTVDMEVSTPIASNASIYAVVAFKALNERRVLSGDFGAAFLNTYILAEVKILARLDKVNSELLCQLRPKYRSYLNMHDEITVKLDPAHFGCVQSTSLGITLFELLLNRLASMQFRGDEGTQCTLRFHVCR